MGPREGEAIEAEKGEVFTKTSVDPPGGGNGIIGP